MKLKIKLFGSLTDDIGNDVLEIHLSNDTDSLLCSLKQHFPILSQKKFLMSVDKKIIVSNTTITNFSEIALLPPFSGG